MKRFFCTCAACGKQMEECREIPLCEGCEQVDRDRQDEHQMYQDLRYDGGRGYSAQPHHLDPLPF